MTPWTLLDTAPIPDGGGRLRLLRRGSEYVIRLDDGAELMSSRVGGSEEALARLGCVGLPPSPRPRVLIGGLGMGFTLRAALGLLGPDASIVGGGTCARPSWPGPVVLWPTSMPAASTTRG